MYTAKMQRFQQRIGFTGDLRIVLRVICKDYKLGNYVDHKIITVGYEDLNIKLQTDHGIYLIKILSNERDYNNRQRYLKIIQQILDAGIAHPKVYQTSLGYLYKITPNGTPLYLFVMKYIHGHNLYELKHKLNKDELLFITKQIILIANIRGKVDYYYDDWSVVNLVHEFKKIKNHLHKEDLALVAPVVEQFAQIDLESFPHTFVHGDLLDTNILKEKSGKLWIIDFSVVNYYPRIHELAVFLCGPAFNPNNPNSFLRNYKLILDKYLQFIPLKNIEIDLLPLYIKAAHAMNIVGATRDIIEESLSDESLYWINTSRKGLSYLSQVFN
jgi:Ser/Thr protein kinase RdoA (MazF antagonist)